MVFLPRMRCWMNQLKTEQPSLYLLNCEVRYSVLPFGGESCTCPGMHAQATGIMWAAEEGSPLPAVMQQYSLASSCVPDLCTR